MFFTIWHSVASKANCAVDMPLYRAAGLGPYYATDTMRLVLLRSFDFNDCDPPRWATLAIVDKTLPGTGPVLSRTTTCGANNSLLC